MGNEIRNFVLFHVLTAFTLASPTYSGPGRLPSVGLLGKTGALVAGGRVGHHDHGLVGTKLGGVGHGGFGKFDAGRLVHDTVYNPRRRGVSQSIKSHSHFYSPGKQTD